MAVPTAELARQVAADFSGERVRSCERFTTGLRHWVYDVELGSGSKIVVRLGLTEHRDELAGGVYWSEQLWDRNVPVARVLDHRIDAVPPFMILERLPGTDLGNVIASLHNEQLREIATGVAAMQRQAGTLPVAGGFGYAVNYQQPLEPSWLDVLTNEIDRAERWINAAGVVDRAHVDFVRNELAAYGSNFDDVEPRAFLHDATTKNVIVHDGQVRGLVDVDTMAFGDPLWAIALTRMSLLAADRSTEYTDLLATAMDQTNSERLDLYTRITCLTFLGELGQRFNADQPPTVDHTLRHRLESLLA